MGGFGSGRSERFVARRPTLSTLHRFDVRWVQRHGLLDGGSYLFPWLEVGRLTLLELARVGDTLTLDWPVDGMGSADHALRITLHLNETRCHYGGHRPWVHCPRCGRRVAVLYGSVVRLRCHRCSHRPYASQCRTEEARLYQKAWKLRKRLGASRTLTEPISPSTKPKGMHWRTWERLRAQEEQAQERILDAYNRSLAARLLTFEFFDGTQAAQVERIS